ncbi:unnamed protein product [Caenorhabditis angaria]|uniref:CHK kinase-like domain-containing protein n=1 Tax=Caenorhabditis angaria TaxID=860376 RepID=A0A9P1IBB7_9PELO|nr:unnamed protein product [Caenorhabditis angaria]
MLSLLIISVYTEFIRPFIISLYRILYSLDQKVTFLSINMSLHELSDGILGTNVSLKDIEEAFGGAEFGENVKVTNISDMKGFMSRIALIEPDWKIDTGLPKKFAVKIASQLALMEISKISGKADLEEEKLKKLDENFKVLNNREVDVYNLLTELKIQEIPIIKIYATRKFSESNTLKAFIISEYVENLSNIKMYETIGCETILPIIRGAAAFSAIGETIDINRLNFAGGFDCFQPMISDFVEKTAENAFKIMRRHFSEIYQNKIEDLAKITDLYLNKVKISEIVNIVDHEPVLTHSDLWPSNVMIVENKLHAIIDWQAVSFGSPAQDIGLLIASCLSTKDRREKLDFLLEEYYNTFLKKIEGHEVPYSFEQLKQNYQLMFPALACMILPWIMQSSEHIQDEYLHKNVFPYIFENI